MFLFGRIRHTPELGDDGGGGGALASLLVHLHQLHLFLGHTVSYRDIRSKVNVYL